MTRDAEHTPSPQSVVVLLEDWQHVIGALKNAKARLPMGAAIGNVSDALSKVEHLQAAPAPSSLAGGEVEGESVALMLPFWVSWWGAPGTFELHRPWWVSGEREDGKQSICAAVLAQDEFTARLSVQWTHDDKDAALEWRFVEEKPKGWSPFGDRFRQADWMRWPESAALSPEAPAREGVEMKLEQRLRDRAKVSTDPMLAMLARQAADALTPRHEAPAEPVSDRYKFDDEITWLREAARYFSARDTKGEDLAHWANVYNAENAENARKLADRLAELSSNPCRLGAPAEGARSFSVDDLAQEIRRVDGNHDLGAGALAEALLPYLRARSSAPEAREVSK